MDRADSGSAAKAASARKLIASAMRSADVSFDARGLFVLIASYANPDGSRCFPSWATLARVSGHDRRWIMRHLRELKAAGWISTTTRKTPTGTGNVYHLQWRNIGPEKQGEG